MQAFLFSQEWTYRKYNESNLLPTNFVYDLCQDKDNALILATDVGLYRFNGTSISTITSSVFFSKVKPYNNFFYALSKEGIIFKYQGGIEVEKIRFKNSEAWNDFEVTQAFIYAISDRSLAVFDRKKNQENTIKSSYGLGLKLVQVQENTVAIFESGIQVYKRGKLIEERAIRGILNAKVFDNRLEVLTDNSTQIFTISNSLDPFGREESDSFFEVEELANNSKIYINEKLVQYVSTKGESFTISGSEFLDHGIHISFVDNIGGLWLSEKGKGLYYISSPEVLRFNTDSEINKIIDWNDFVVFATNGGLTLNRFGTPIKSYFKGKEILDVVGDKNAIYVATKTGLYFIDTSYIEQQVSIEVLTQLLLDTDNRTLYGSTYSKGLVAISIENYVHQYFDISAGLSHNVVTDLCLHRDTLYLVTPAGGFDRMVNKRLLDKQKNSLSTTVFNSLFSLDNRLLYAASPNSGIFEFNSIDNTTEEYNFEHLVYSIFSNQDQLWVTHDKGLDVLISKKEYFALFKPEDPTDFLPFSNGLHQAKNELFLGVKGGYLRIEPQDDILTQTAHLKISEISLNDQNIVVDSVLNLPFQKHRLKIRVDNIDFRKANSGIIEYSISNFSNGWRVLKEDVLEIPELSEGEYEIKFRFKNNPGAESVALKINIESPIWKKIWFWLLMIVVLAFLVFFYINWRTRALRAEKIRLEGLVDLRTLALYKKNDELKQLSYVISHDFKNPVINITTISEMLSNNQFPEDKKQEAFTHLTNTSKGLYSNLIGMIELLKIEDSSNVTERFNLSEVINEIKVSISTQIQDSNAQILEVDTDLEIKSNRFYIYSSLYNLIINSIKYRSELDPKIVIRTVKKEGNLILTVKDNGLGFTKDDAELLFTPFRRIHNHTEGSGLGLALIKKMIESLGGNIWAESTPGDGSEFIISLPIN